MEKHHDHDHTHDHDHDHVPAKRGHSHGPGQHHHHGASDNIKVALALNLGFSIIELVGGLWTGSVAVLSDAVHDFGDTLALALAYLAERVSRRKSTAEWSYGYRRFSLLSALITAIFLIAASVGVLMRAIPRLTNPEMPNLNGMLGLAVLGIAVNGYAALRLKHGKTMNERVVSWHMIEDVLGWVAVLIGTLVMKVVDLPIIDPLLSIGFTLFLFYGVARTLRDTLRLFLQATPTDVDLPALRRDVERLPNVTGTHDAHLWSLDGDSHVMTMHVVVRADASAAARDEVKGQVRALLAKRGKIHATLEIESEAEICAAVDCVQG